MNVSDFTNLLQDPSLVVEPVQTNQLEDVLASYPYFQAARALHLKGLKNLNSFKYNNALKVTAAYTSDRDILFDFITSETFTQNAIADSLLGRKAALEETETIAEEVAAEETKTSDIIEDRETNNSFLQGSREAEKILDPTLFKSKDPKIDLEIAQHKKKAKEALEIGKPLPFTKKEKYSFGQWLQLTSAKLIDRKEEKPTPAKTAEDVKKKKFDLIDKFIAENPKISPNINSPKVDIKSSIKIDKNELMTETLAKVYLEQKKYKKAIQAYKILSLKYPEKSGFFADRIKSVKRIQQENL